MATDKHQGKGGTFIVSGNERHPATPDKDGYIAVGDKKLYRPDTKPHKDGDAPRDAKGRLDRDEAHEAAAKPQPAIAEAAGTQPWATPVPEEKKTDNKAKESK